MHSVLLSLGLLGFGAALLGAAPEAVDVAMFRGDAAHSGRFEGSGPQRLGAPKWRFKTGGPVVSSPTIAAGVLYIGSDDKAVYALDAATGAQRWKFPTKGLVRSTPAVVKGSVFVGSYDGALYAVDAATGEQRWRFETGGERKFTARGLHGMQPRMQAYPDPWDCYLSSPAVADGLVFFGSGDGHVYALDVDDGTLRWKFATGDVVHASPAVADGTVYVGSWDAFFYALDARTGAVRWKLKTGADPENHNAEGIQSSATVVDGVVYFGCRDFHVYAVDAASGRELWKTKYTWVNATPTVRDGWVYGSTSIPALFFALDAKTGKEAYRIDVKLPAFASTAVVDGRAFVGTFGGSVYQIDLRERKIASEFRTEASRLNARGALNADGTINGKALFPTDFFEQMTVAVDALMSLGAILSSPTIDGTALYVGSADGHVYAFGD